MLIAPLIVELFGTPGGDFDLAVGLSRLLFPIVILLGLSGIIVGILNAYDQFTVPALTPVAWNLVIILGLVLGVPAAGSQDGQLYVYAGSIVLATLVQLLMPVPVASRARRPAADRARLARSRGAAVLRPHAPGDADARADQRLHADRHALRLAPDRPGPRAPRDRPRLPPLHAPAGDLLGGGCDRALSDACRGSPRAATWRAFGRTVDTGIRQIGFLLIPAGLVSAVLAEPITRLVYERGEFTPDQTPVVAGALAAFSVGLVFNGWMLLLNRAFYGLKANWIPTLVALGNLALNVVLFAALYRVGVWGLPLAVSLSNLAGAVALAILMWRRIGGVEAASTLTALTRIIVASVVASALAVGVWWAVDAAVGRSTIGQILSVGLGLGVGTVGYLGISRLLGVRELGSLFALRRGA